MPTFIGRIPIMTDRESAQANRDALIFFAASAAQLRAAIWRLHAAATAFQRPPGAPREETS